MGEQTRKIKELWPWIWTWRRPWSVSASLWSGRGRRTSASPGRSCWCFAGISNARGGCSLKDVRRSRSRPSRLSCQGRSGVACFYALFVAHDSSQSTTCMFATARLRHTKPVMPCQHTLRRRWKKHPNC